MAAPHTAARPARIALVDDEAHLRETVAYSLERAGYRVDTYPDGSQAWAAFEQRLPDLAVLDILMPGVDGLELCRRLRTQSLDLPIVFLTSKDEEFDKVLGLEIGADDYLCKPFSMRELLARVRVLFRRRALQGIPTERSEEVLQRGALELDLERYTATWRDAPVALTVTEFLILRALVERPGIVKSREQLMREGYPHDAYVSPRTIDSHIKRIRRKVEALDERFAGVETVHGLGYRYRANDTEETQG